MIVRPAVLAFSTCPYLMRLRQGRQGGGGKELKAVMREAGEIGERRFGRVNWLGLATLAGRETRRFLAIWRQTLLAPLVTASLFLTVFALAIGPNRGDVMGVPFLTFLAPGILTMTVIQNAFTATSSSLMSAKVQGNIVDTLMPPLSAGEIVAGYVAGGLARGFGVALSVWLILWLGLGIGLAHPLWALVFVVIGSIFMAALGLIAALLATKFDHMSAITNFIVVPLSFLSGTFYSIEALPPTMQIVTRLNPFFYLIDGVRFGVIGVSDHSPWLGLPICLVVTGCALAVCWRWFSGGFRLKP